MPVFTVASATSAGSTSSAIRLILCPCSAGRFGGRYLIAFRNAAEGVLLGLVATDLAFGQLDRFGWPFLIGDLLEQIVDDLQAHLLLVFGAGDKPGGSGGIAGGEPSVCFLLLLLLMMVCLAGMFRISGQAMLLVIAVYLSGWRSGGRWDLYRYWVRESKDLYSFGYT